MNKLLKTIILAVYTIVLFSLTVLVINNSFKPNRLKGYSNSPSDEFITMNAQVIEVRKTAKEEESDYEYTKYDLRLFLTKLKNVAIENIYAFVTVETKNGKYSYTETSSSRSMGEGTYQNSAISFLNASTAFAYKKATVEDEKLKEFKDYTPSKIAIKLNYDVKVDKKTVDSNGAPITVKENEHHELNYIFDYDQVKVNQFSKYEEREVTSDGFKVNTEPFQLKVLRTTSTTANTETYKVYALKTVKENLPEGVTIKKANVVVTGVVTNKDAITSEYFDEYVNLFTYNGAMNAERPITTSRDTTISRDYKIEKIYITSTIELSNGKKVNTNYCVPVTNLLTK